MWLCDRWEAEPEVKMEMKLERMRWTWFGHGLRKDPFKLCSIGSMGID